AIHEAATSVHLAFSGAVARLPPPDALGAFSFATTNASLGTVQATAVNNSNKTMSAEATLAVANPVITLAITYDSQKNVTLSGSVADLDPAGLIVSFKGVVEGVATTD